MEAQPKVSLEQVWTADVENVKEMLVSAEHPINSNDLVNRISLLKVYNESGQLSQEDSSIVSHPDFKRIALSTVRLDEIKTKLLTLIYLDPLFNERNLVNHFNDYNPVDKVYLFTTTGLEVRNSETLDLERVFPLDPTMKYGRSLYHKGKLYFTQWPTRRIAFTPFINTMVSLNLNSGEKTSIVQALAVKKIIGDLLYYIDPNHCLASYNLNTGKIETTDLYIAGRGNRSFYDGNFMYYYERIIKTFSTYDISTSPIKLVRRQDVPDPEASSRIIGVIGERVYFSNGKIYDLETLEEIGSLDIQVRHIDRYENKIYALDHLTKDIYVYDSTTYAKLGKIETIKKDLRLVDMELFGNKLVVIIGGESIEIFNLDDNSSIVLKSPTLTFFYTIG
jgi:hypothetical protein